MIRFHCMEETKIAKANHTHFPKECGKLFSLLPCHTTYAQGWHAQIKTKRENCHFTSWHEQHVKWLHLRPLWHKSQHAVWPSVSHKHFFMHAEERVGLNKHVQHCFFVMICLDIFYRVMMTCHWCCRFCRSGGLSSILGLLANLASNIGRAVLWEIWELGAGLPSTAHIFVV